MKTAPIALASRRRRRALPAMGQKKAVKAAGTGRFEYFCAYHRFMEGTVEVVE